jgi:hypothetical protein
MVPPAVFGIVHSGLVGPKKQFAQAGLQGQDQSLEAPRQEISGGSPARSHTLFFCS